MLSRLYKIFWPIFIVSACLFLPIFFQPDIFLSRGNDLEEFFWPIYYFVKQQIFINKQIPFWYPHILSGTPLLPDPQSGIFYLPNFVFLLLSIDTGFIVSSFLHVLIGGIGMYFLAKKGFKLSPISSVFSGCLYVAIPKLAAAMEAGHFGLIQAHAWLPFIALAAIQLARKPNLNWSVLLAISSAGLFFTHPTTFMYASICSAFLFLTQIHTINARIVERRSTINKAAFFAIGAALCFGLIAVAFLPQLAWLPQTNREFLLNDPQVYPIWNSKIEFIKAIFFNQSLETEKAIVLGIIPSILAVIGFLKLNNKNKLLIFLTGLAIALISLNNASPFYQFLLTQKWYVMARVTTRIWFIIIMVTILLAAYGLEKIKQLKKLIFLLAVFELLVSSWILLTKPVQKPDKYVNQKVYQLLEQDSGLFRVFCTNRCIPQKEAVKRGIYLIEGYSTLISKDYITLAWQLTGTYWTHYSLALPPFGFYDTVVPDPVSLGKQNTKYIISPKTINHKDLQLVLTTDKHFVYLNKAFLPFDEQSTYRPPKSYYDGKTITLLTLSCLGLWLLSKLRLPHQQLP